MFDQALHARKERREIYAFDGPPSEDDRDLAEGWRHRIKIEFSHNKARKCYEAGIYKCLVADRGDYRMERFDVIPGSGIVFSQVSAPRFSESKFLLFCMDEIESIYEVLADESCTSRTAELLRVAKSYADAASAEAAQN